MLGQPIDLSQHAQAVSAMVCVASRLGLQRRARDVPHGNQAVAAYVLDGRTSAAKAFDRLGFRVGNPLGNWVASAGEFFQHPCYP